MSKLENFGRNMAAVSVMALAGAVGGCGGEGEEVLEENFDETNIVLEDPAEEKEAEQIPAPCDHPGITVENGRVVAGYRSARNCEDPANDPFLNCQDALAGRDCAGLRDEGFNLLDEGGLLDIIDCDEDGNPRYKSLHSPFTLERNRLDFRSREGDCTDVTRVIRDRLSMMASRVACDPETNEPYEDLTQGIGSRPGGRVSVPGSGHLK